MLLTLRGIIQGVATKLTVANTLANKLSVFKTAGRSIMSKYCYVKYRRNKTGKTESANKM